MIKKFIYAIFGTRNDRLLKRYLRTCAKINALEEEVSQLANTDFKNKTNEFKDRYQKGESLATLLPEAFALCREASIRTLKMRHFDVQLIGGMVLHDGKIAEMKTGEGKTLVATLAVYLNAIANKGVHVVTVNDYLAKRDALEMSKLYNFLGLSVGINLPDMSHQEKQRAYACDITYGTNNEFGFDYLRDNMVFDIKEKVQRSLNFAVVDEVDSILIDEARTPLIISGPTEDSEELYIKLNQIPQLLEAQEAEDSENGDFWIDEKNRNVILSDKGHEKVETILLERNMLNAGDSLYHVHNIGLMHHLLAALKAHYVYSKDQHYVVQNGEVVIVDEFTGRLMSGRRWSDGLHQAVEAKEKVAIQRENQTLASITFQNYFRMYQKLSGMTGTADTEAFEFQQIYTLETVVIPTNKPMIRIDANDKIYMNVNDKYAAIINDIKECTHKNQPVLVGTTSVENSEVISRLLTAANLQHEVLNAKQNAREAEIIMQAGAPGAITVATNMAGRGTDIILGGSFKQLVAKIEEDEALNNEEKATQIEKIMLNWKQKNAEVLASGGLYIIGTERHESRRIDNQLRGRSGRQGDPGASRFYLSLDDPLLRIFGGERMRSLMQRLGMQAGEAIEHKWLSRSIESAQRKVEGHNFDIRKQLLEYDDVSNDQRRVIYQQRDDVLTNDNLATIILSFIAEVVGTVFDSFIPPKAIDDDFDINGLELSLKNDFGQDLNIEELFNSKLNIEAIRSKVIDLIQVKYKAKMTEFANVVNNDTRKFIDQIIVENTINLEELNNFCNQNGLNIDLDKLISFSNDNPTATLEELKDYFYQLAGNDLGDLQANRVERNVLLQHIDQRWREHLTDLEHLRQGIHLRGYAQKDPKQEYKAESFMLFSNMLDNIKIDVAKMMLLIQINVATNSQLPNEAPKKQILHHDSMASIFTENSTANQEDSPRRNSPCFCGSGKKYKHCHGKA